MDKRPSKLSVLMKTAPEGDEKFPIYRANTIAAGRVFAEVSMGLFGRVEHRQNGHELSVKVFTQKPVLAALGCQLAGWTFGNSMISGPLRLKVMKPGFIFKKINFGALPKIPNLACVEGNAKPDEIIAELTNNGITSAEILLTSEDSKAQFVNIPARAIEIALLRLFFLADLNKFKITKAVSSVTANLSSKNLISDLNDAIRFNGHVTLMGSFGGFKEFDQIVTKNTGFADEKFETVMKERGSIADCPVDLFSVAHLTVVDTGKTKVY